MPKSKLHDDCYPMMLSCYEMVESLNDEKSLGFNKLQVFLQATKMYGNLMAGVAAKNSDREGPKSIMDFVDWGGDKSE